MENQGLARGRRARTAAPGLQGCSRIAAPDPGEPAPVRVLRCGAVADPEDTRVSPTEGEEEEEEEEYAETPFDNPFFLPVLFFGFAIWLFYDGFLNDAFIQRNLDEGDHFAIAFNRYGSAVAALLCIWFTVKAFRARRADPD